MSRILPVVMYAAIVKNTVMSRILLVVMYAAIVTLNTQVQRVAEVSGRRQDIMVEHSSR